MCFVAEEYASSHPSKVMSTGSQLGLGTDTQRYEALFRISKALSACGEPEELARILAEQLFKLISFDHIDILVFKETSDEIEWHVWGKGPIAFPDLPIEETPIWHVYRTQEPLHIADWNGDARFLRLRQLLETSGFKLGSLLRVPLTTAHRRLGTLGIASQLRNAYRSEDVSFLQLVARVVALVIDDALNLRKSQATRLELERQNTRLKLLLDLTNRITSNLDLPTLLRAISESVRQVMECDLVAINLLDSESGKFRFYAVDFPNSRGFFPGGPTYQRHLCGTPEKLAIVGGFMNRTIPFATELKASAGSEPTRDTQDNPGNTAVTPRLVACLLLLPEDAEAILSFLRGLAVNGRAFPSDKATNENSVLSQPACQDAWLGHSAAAAYLGVSKSTLYHYSCHAQIERRKLCGRLEYRRSALDKFKEDHTQPANCRSSSARIIGAAHSSGK
jgi:GAF domain-containing protein